MTCLVQSPAIDFVVIGLQDGRIVLHNLRANKTLATFRQTKSAVLDLSFRTDGVDVLASASASGQICIWDLEAKQLRSIIRQAHSSRVVSIKFFAGEPILLSSGADNALKMWIFDRADGSARLLRSRAGHSAPPTQIRFYSTTDNILSSSAQERSLRLFSVTRDERNREISQGKIERRAKAMVSKFETMATITVFCFLTGMMTLVNGMVVKPNTPELFRPTTRSAIDRRSLLKGFVAVNLIATTT